MLRSVALGVALLVVASGAGGVAFAATPAPSGDAPSSSAAQTSQQASPGNGPAAQQTKNKQFEFDIVRTSNCGIACRDVTIRVTNVGDDPARNVRATTRLKAGNQVVWRGSDSVRKLAPGESKTVTKRVRLGPFDALQVRQNGGHLTANTTVTWDGGRETFTERQKVA